MTLVDQLELLTDEHGIRSIMKALANLCARKVQNAGEMDDDSEMSYWQNVEDKLRHIAC